MLDQHLKQLLDSLAHPKTICPSEVARALSTKELEEAGMGSWREAMPEVRKLVAEMRLRGETEILQKEVLLEGDLGKGLEAVVGPIRIRKTIRIST